MDVIGRVLMLCLVAMVSLSALAKDNALYRWQDQQGQWHFGDAAEANAKPKVTVVQAPPETANFIKTKVIRVSVSKSKNASGEAKSKNKAKQTTIVSVNQKKQDCDKRRDDLRFKAFRSTERDSYDHECVNAIKW